MVRTLTCVLEMAELTSYLGHHRPSLGLSLIISTDAPLPLVTEEEIAHEVLKQCDRTSAVAPAFA
jgi:hypothetical protein